MGGPGGESQKKKEGGTGGNGPQASSPRLRPRRKKGSSKRKKGEGGRGRGKPALPPWLLAPARPAKRKEEAGGELFLLPPSPRRGARMERRQGTPATGQPQRQIFGAVLNGGGRVKRGGGIPAVTARRPSFHCFPASGGRRKEGNGGKGGAAGGTCHRR